MDKTATSTNDYVALVSLRGISPNNSYLVIQLYELNVNAVKVKIQASNMVDANDDLVDARDLLAETVVLKNGSLPLKTLTNPMRNIDVLIASNVAATHGSVRCAVSGA